MTVSSVLVAEEPLTAQVAELLTYSLDSQLYQHVDTLLQCADIERMPLETLFLVMDHTFSIKQHLPYWQEFRTRLIREFNNRGLDTKALLGPFMDNTYENA